MGHRDTVFDKGEASRRPFRIAADRAYGPGVADMKAGLVMNAIILAAFQRFAPDVPRGRDDDGRRGDRFPGVTGAYS